MNRISRDFTREEYQKATLTIVADAAISNAQVNGGRLVPLVIVDTTGRPEIDAVISSHKSGATAGDVSVIWGQVEGKASVSLFVQFIRPVETFAVLEFDILRQGVLVDQILYTRSLYIASGRPGDRLKHDIDRPKIIVEIVAPEFTKAWDQIYFKTLEKHFRLEGFSRSRAARAAEEVIAKMRALGSFRFPTQTSD